MRWERLFEDLEGRFDDLSAQEVRAEAADRQRVAAGRLLLASRLAGAVGADVRLRTVAGLAVDGRLRHAGPDWVLVEDAAGADVVVHLAAVTVVHGLTTVTGPAATGVAARLDLRHALRGLARDRAPVVAVVTGPGPSGGPSEVAGTVDRVGADFVELGVHAPWEPRRPSGTRSVAAVPLAQLVVVRALPWG
ncbi:hypothetical protein [Nakamurella endophytica]|uniref:hypothetical protein n=1 Tax=Nakamurella endophytica TaxID=1748367 RepID=UPI001665F77F|nr:hypothetical protein [Nakamurella endophytica]